MKTDFVGYEGFLRSINRPGWLRRVVFRVTRLVSRARIRFGTLQRAIGYVSIIGLLMACQPNPARPVADKQADSLRLFAYIKAGDSVYALRRGYGSFAASLGYYDRAQTLADRWQDRLMQAEVVFAKGRVYDAWNKDPQQTVRYFARASRLYQSIPGQYRRYIYTKHLVAHAYDKMLDSTGATRVLTELLAELAGKDTAQLHQLPYTTEMALIATEVRAYPLARQILTRLTRRAWIQNDSGSYDYLNHYYLTRSRLDAAAQKALPSPYVDSLQIAFRQSRNLMDSLYYSSNLARLYAAQGQYRQAHAYWKLEQQLDRRLNHDPTVARMQQTMLQSELLAEKNKLAQQRTLRQTRLALLWGLGGLLAVITLMSVLLYRRNRIYRTQSKHLLVVNNQLDRKVELVELLHKEMQHRIKNNLNLVYSLLQMQERQARQPATIEALQQARLRVESVARLQEQLGTQSEAVDLTDFCKELVTSVVACFSAEQPVVTHLDLTPSKLPPAHYLPLSLILTEWVINSLKHAVPAGPALEISVTLGRQQGLLQLDYADNGQSTAADQQHTTGRLGQEIVTLLCRQLNAVLTTAPARPYQYQLVFSHVG